MRWRTWRALSISPYVWVNLPAHFMIRPVIDEMEVLVDCFRSGEILFVQDVEEMLKGYYQVRRRAPGIPRRRCISLNACQSGLECYSPTKATLVHFSAQCEQFLWDTLGDVIKVPVTKTAQVEPKDGRM